MELTEADLKRLDVQTLLRISGVKGVNTPVRPKKAGLIERLVATSPVKRSFQPDESEAGSGKRMRLTPLAGDAKGPTRSATPDATCRSLFQDQGGVPFPATAQKAQFRIPAPLHPGSKQPVWLKDKRPRQPTSSSALGSLLSVLPGNILRFNTYTDKVQLFLVAKELQGVMVTSTAWDPFVVTGRESKHLCMNFYSRTITLSPCQRQIVRTHQESKSLTMELWDRPMYERPLTDDEPSDRDDALSAERKRERRARREKANAANFAHAALLFHVLRFRSLQDLKLSNVPPEYGCKLVKDVRRSFKHLGHFRVFWEQNAYTVVAKNQEPAPLDVDAMRLENAQRFHSAQRDEHRNRFMSEVFVNKPDEVLSPKEALFLMEFSVVVKVWSTTVGLFPVGEAADRPAKVVFNFCVGGSSYRHIRKGEARELYADVLQKLKELYPTWGAGIEDSQAPQAPQAS